MDTQATNKPFKAPERSQKEIDLLAQLHDLHSEAQLKSLAQKAENHISPEFKAQLLQSDLALANALRELVDLERARVNVSALQKMETGRVTSRATLYPLRRPGKIYSQDSYSGSIRLGQRTITLKAWIAANAEFINLEASLL